MKGRQSWKLLAAAMLLALPVRVAAQTDDIVLLGAWEYHLSCAVCHGPDGDGNGALKSALKVAPPDLTKLAERNGGTFPFSRVFDVIDGRISIEGHGRSDMPVWGRMFQRDLPAYDGSVFLSSDPELVVSGRIYALAKYLRAIQGGKTIPLVEPQPRRRGWPDDIPSPVYPGTE